jgi:hypothetical protein
MPAPPLPSLLAHHSLGPALSFSLGPAAILTPAALIVPKNAHGTVINPTLPAKLLPTSCRAGSSVLRLPCLTIQVRLPFRFLLDWVGLPNFKHSILISSVPLHAVINLVSWTPQVLRHYASHGCGYRKACKEDRFKIRKLSAFTACHQRNVLPSSGSYSRRQCPRYRQQLSAKPRGLRSL